MAIHTHSDDEPSKGAVTMVRYAAEGYRVKVVTCTGGEAGSIFNPAMDRLEVRENTVAVRVHEMAVAAEALGVKHEWFGFTDLSLPAGNPVSVLSYGMFARQSVKDAAKSLIRVIRELRPHVVITYDENGGYPHPDHIMTHIVFMRAWLESRTDKYSEFGESWETSKLYYIHGFIKVHLIASDNYYRDNGLENPLAESFRRWTKTPGDIMTCTATQVECGDYFQQRDQVLLAHAVQIDPNGPFFVAPVDIQQRVWPIEELELAHIRVQTELPETDLFAGIDPDAEQSGINAKLELTIESLDALAIRTTIFLAQNPTGSRGTGFGEASPVGLLIIVTLLIAILAPDWDLSCRVKRLAARWKFARAHGMDLFDSEAVDEAMAAAKQRREAEQLALRHVRAALRRVVVRP